VVEIHKGIGRPEDLAQGFAADQFTGVLDQVDKNAEGLLADFHLHPVAPQLRVGCVDLENAEAPDPSVVFKGFQS